LLYSAFIAITASLTGPLWLRAKVDQYAALGENEKKTVQNNIFWNNIKVEGDSGSGVTVFKMENMTKIKNIKDDIKHDAYRLLSAISPDGNAMKVLKTYHMLLNGFGYGRGSMTVVFEPSEFYDISSWVDNELVPSMNEENYTTPSIQLHGKKHAMSDLINNVFSPQLAGYLTSYMVSETKESKKDKEFNLSLYNQNGPVWVDYDILPQSAPIKKGFDQGILKIKMTGIEELLVTKTRDFGYNLAITPNIYTSENVIRTLDGEKYIDLQRNGSARVYVQRGLNVKPGDAIYVDGAETQVVEVSKKGGVPWVLIKLKDSGTITRSHEADNSKEITEEDLDAGKTANPLAPC